jgi:hypothetical protein
VRPAGLAQGERESPGWFDEMDPLDALFHGTVWPRQFRDPYQFGNARTAWLSPVRAMPHCAGIEQLVTEVVRVSEVHQFRPNEGEPDAPLIGDGPYLSSTGRPGGRIQCCRRRIRPVGRVWWS